MDERISRREESRSAPAINKALLTVVSLTLLFMANFKIGWSVSVDGRSLGGVYAPGALDTAVESAEAAASEILGTDVSLRDAVRVRPRIIVRDYSRDTLAIERALLDGAPGIIRRCAVRVDGEFIGWAAEQSEFAEMLESLITEKCGPYTVSAGFTKTITAKYSYAPESAPCNSMEMTRLIRDMDIVEVINEEPAETSPDGIVRW